MEIQRSPELEAVVRRLWKAFAEGSAPALANLLSDDPALRFVLSSDDSWFGQADTLATLLAERGGRIGVERVEFDRIEAFQAGDVGWAALQATTALSTGETLSFRQTAVFAIQDGIWRIVQSHTSRGVPDQDTFGYDIAAGLAELLRSLTEEEEEDITEAVGASGLVTLMFTDIEGSTLLSHEVGESAWIDVVQRHFNEIARIVEECDGTVVKTLGDGAMAAFSTARGAADAAIAIQRSHNNTGIAVRIGIHTGEAVAVGGDFAGISVAKAARVASAAGGGEILVSSATKELLARFEYSMGEERSAELKGLPGTHRLIPLMY
ncbi:MAG: nuclear transport factor 2 family protein [Acidimicrobiia bacterium]|nr:nuclear transport factor 2 family protein [Acidimicrobiia bacterium]